VVDAAMRYDRDWRLYILLIRNALYVPSLDHNLMPPFMMREAGVILKDTPKTQLDDPSEKDHALTIRDWLQNPTVPLGNLFIFSNVQANQR
jgi:hypothetical protein